MEASGDCGLPSLAVLLQLNNSTLENESAAMMVLMEGFIEEMILTVINGAY